ncbi:MAG: hypothetical protein HFH87_02820 [Lachnospiraceae bacterium]|nr:hypothetical protein [Lachnospiraceae bacterium]
MRIERSYYTQELKLIEAQSKEWEQEVITWTKEEKQKYLESEQHQLKKIYTHIEEEKYHIIRVMNQEKMNIFQNMSEKAIAWAEDMITDLLIDITDQLQGMIQFKTDIILFTYETPPRCRAYFLEIIEMADEIWIDAEEKAYTMVFWFNLYDEIKK